MSQQSASSKSTTLVPIWAQMAIGAAILGLVVLVSINTSFYVSDWSTTNSSFYINAADALNHSRVHIYQGRVPTLVFFWDQECKVCKKSIAYLKSIESSINVVGVYLGAEANDKNNIKLWWLKNAPRRAVLYFDDRSMLEKTFQVHAIPANFLIFPKQKKLLAHIGNLNIANPTSMNWQKIQIR